MNVADVEMLMLSQVEGTCYHQIQPRTDVLWCLCYKPILIQTVCRSHCALFVSTFSCDWILIWQALCQDCADAIELEWGQAPAISGINTVIMSAARFKRRFALTMHALQPKPKMVFFTQLCCMGEKSHIRLDFNLRTVYIFERQVPFCFKH